MLMKNWKDAPNAGSGNSWNFITANKFATLLKAATVKKFLIIDVRSSLEFCSCHIADAINIACSRRFRPRTKRIAFSKQVLLHLFSLTKVGNKIDVIVYDHATIKSESLLRPNSNLGKLLRKLSEISKTVSVLKGGFCQFRAMHPSLCTSRNDVGSDLSTFVIPDRSILHPPHHVSLSQPCLPVSNLGPTKILPYLFLGSQTDAHCEETMAKNGITYVLNVSVSSPRPAFIQDGHFLRIPVNDGYSDKLSPFFNEAFQFLDKVREASGCVLVHCLAGVSRSPTLAIAYIMHSLSMTMDEAYRYVKDKRPTISPNFNFLGQLLEYEKQLNAKEPDEIDALPSEVLSKKQRMDSLPNASNNTIDCSQRASATLTFATTNPPMSLTSPTAALARLNFSQLSPLREQPSPSVDEVPLDIPFNSTTPAGTSNLTVRLGPKHCGTKRPLSDPGFGSQTVDENGQLASNTMRPLVRPSSISFACAASVGTRRKAVLTSSWNSMRETESGSGRTFVLSSPHEERHHLAWLDKLPQPNNEINAEEESGQQEVKTQLPRETLLPANREQRSKPEVDSRKSLTSQPVCNIQLCESSTSKSNTPSPNKLPLPVGNSLLRTLNLNQPCNTLPLQSVDMSKPKMTFVHHTVTADLPFETVNLNHQTGVVKTRHADQAVSFGSKHNFAEQPQTTMARKSRSLEDMLGCPFPNEVKNSSDQCILSDCKKRSSYLIGVLASPVTLGIDNHLFCCQTTNSDSFQSPSSTDNLEMIPVS